MRQELKLQSEKDAFNFEISLGGNAFNDYVYFNMGAAGKAEKWQILSPVRGMAYGVRGLNRFIQTTFREATIKWAQSKYRKIPSPMGLESVVYGDKVINVSNHFHRNVYPTQDSLKYVANGEIGMVVGQFKYPTFKGMPRALEVEFSSQPGFKYTYGSQYFNEEASSFLELAYAITVHKAQGSEFGLCFLILPNPCRLLSRELLYTALTRQKERIVILHQGDLADIWQYTTDYNSDTAKRFTNLFSPPKLQLIQGNYMEEKLIHRSVKGEAMRSKSEVIIANLLNAAHIQYEYEKVLVGDDGKIRLPDFTIEDAESGVTYYWEHDGMPGNKEYNERWKTKLDWYRDQNILPYENGGGEQGTLIVTYDELNGGINTQQIQSIINEIWL